MVGKLWLGDDQAFAASVKDSAIQIENEKGWKSWLKDKEHLDLQQHIDELKGKLANSSTPSKGLGKTGKKGNLKGQRGHLGASK